MNRRQFLLFRTERATRVAELSCERLYMHYQQAGATVRSAPDLQTAELCDLSELEPPARFAERTTGQLLSEVDHELRAAEVVRLVDSGWLAVEPFGRDVDAVLAAFRRRGGRVEDPRRTVVDDSMQAATEGDWNHE